MMSDRRFHNAFNKAKLAMQAGAKMIRQNGEPAAGYYAAVPHRSFKIDDRVAAKLLEDESMVPLDDGLMPGFPQSWIWKSRGGQR
jgi:hypothetical protein